MPFDIIRPDALPQGLDAMVVSIPRQSGLFAPKAGTATGAPLRRAAASRQTSQSTPKSWWDRQFSAADPALEF